MNESSRPDPLPDSDLSPPAQAPTPKWLSPVYLVIGLISTATGILGLFIPGLPTTVFLIVALWAFSRSSGRLTAWLWRHPKFGPPLRLWHQHRVISPRAKIAAVSVMALSVLILALTTPSWHEPVFVAAVVIPIAAWICTRRSRAPD
jgi:uncharacterized membrane protein YbaN (DUF454 family)